MFLKQFLLGVCGLSFGFLASAGVFTVLASVGLIPRFAGKMHIAKKVLVLEEAVIWGTIIGGLCSVFSEYFRLGEWIIQLQPLGSYTDIGWKVVGGVFVIIYGFFAGMFVGCLALAIAEMLNSIPIFSRRIGFRHGLGVAISAAALGKAAGSLLYFVNEIFLTGG